MPDTTPYESPRIRPNDTEYVPSEMVVLTQANQRQHKSRNYNGPVGLEYYCPSCAIPIQLTYFMRPPKYCPFCGQASLITDAARFRIDYSASLKINPLVYDVMLEEFRKQTAFTDFREYVDVMLHGAKPMTQKEYNARGRRYL